MPIEQLRLALNLPLETTVFGSWPKLPLEAIPQPKRKLFEQRLAACELYCQGELSAEEVAERSGMSARQLLRLMRTALTWHEDGEIYGQRALVPYLHRKAYERRSESPTGTAGLFNQLMLRFPEVQTEIKNAYVRDGKRPKDIHRSMITALELRGVGPDEYPLKNKRRGAGGLQLYLQSLRDEKFRQIAHSQGGRDAGRRADKTEAEEVFRHVTQPYGRVECDGHRTDAIFVLEIEGPDGIVRTVTLHRLVVIVLIDVASRAILGYELCLNRTESQIDLLAAIECALSDTPPDPVTIGGLLPRAGAGLPVHSIPSCAFRIPDELAFDNNLAAISRDWQDRLMSQLQCRVNVGTAGAPEGRAVVESFFKQLTENSFQRLPSTTGGSARSPKRRDPEKKAHRYHLNVAAAKQILATAIGEYNDTPHGTHGHTPLEYIRAWDARGGLIRRLPVEARDLTFLYERTAVLTIRGGIKSGLRPYVQFYDVRYRNAQLAQHGSAIGRKLTVSFDRRNVVTLRAFSAAGEPLGVLKAQGRWGLSPHSLKTRRAIRDLEKTGRLSIHTEDPLENYLVFLKQEARTRRAAANELVRVRRERGEEHPPKETLVPGAPSSIRPTTVANDFVSPHRDSIRQPEPTERRRMGRELSLGSGIHIRRKSPRK